MKGDYQKTLKKLKVNFYFWIQSLLIDEVTKNKRGLEPVTSLSSGYKTSSKKIFISYLLSDKVWWCNVKQFLSYSKTYTCKLMQANSWHHKLIHFHLFFWIWKCGKEEEKLQKFKYFENKKSFLDEIKNISHSFWRAVIWWINKNLIKK